MPRSEIITLVGVDGAGKSTQARLLAGWLRDQGVRAAYFENPGGRPVLTRLAKRLGRADAVALLGPRGFLIVEATVRWVMLFRALLWSRLSRQVAVMDRYTYCQYAMTRARGVAGESLVRKLYAGFPLPDRRFFLDVPPELAQQRVTARGKDHEELSYLRALQAAYHTLPEYADFTVVDGSGSTEAVAAELHRLLEPERRADAA
ncbi:MAG: dTMP kinase [Micromonosporaceae bacterium]